MTSPGGLDSYRSHQRYLVLEERRYKDEELQPLRNLVAAIFRLEKSRTLEDARQVVENLVEWLRAPEQESLARAFAVWLQRVVLPSRLPGAQIPPMQDLREVKAMLEERSIDWSRDWREKGIQEGEAVMLTRLLERRFGPLEETARQRISKADAATLLEWGDGLLTAQRLEDVVG